MNVYKKLQAARQELSKMELKKSGKNTYAKFSYYELGDFLPEITYIFDKIGLCGVVNFGNETAHLTIYDTDAEGQIIFTTPLVHAHMDKVQAIQNLGSTHTYIRRYLWLMAMEIVEHDAVDAVEPQTKPAPKPEPKVSQIEPKREPNVEPKPLDMKGNNGAWQIKISGEGEWDSLIIESAHIMLLLAESPEDCVSIFKINHAIFERMKNEYPDQYKGLMATFKARKEALTPKE